MYYRDTEQTSAELALTQELNAYRKSGCRICLNGRPASPEQVAHACVRENQEYMRDLIDDGTEMIRQINFIRVREENEEREKRQSRGRAETAKRNSQAMRRQ